MVKSLEGGKGVRRPRYYQVFLILSFVGTFGSLALAKYLFEPFLATIPYREEAVIGWSIVIPWFAFMYSVARRMKQSKKEEKQSHGKGS